MIMMMMMNVELSARPDLRDKLVPSHVEGGDTTDMGPDIDELTDDYNNSLNIHDSHTSGLVGKFRSSLKKKISIKGLPSGLVKTPSKASTRRTEHEDGDGDKERAEEEERGEKSEELERSENVEDIEVDVMEKFGDEVQEVDDIVETTNQPVEESVEVKKKKKKKRRPRDEEVEQQEIQVMESTPVKTGAVSGGVEMPDFVESPVVTVETEEISYEVTTEEQQSSSSGKVKKTKRRTHKKRTQENEDDNQVF